jgi:hypothetical protein
MQIPGCHALGLTQNLEDAVALTALKAVFSDRTERSDELYRVLLRAHLAEELKEIGEFLKWVISLKANTVRNNAMDVVVNDHVDK